MAATTPAYRQRSPPPPPPSIPRYLVVLVRCLSRLPQEIALDVFVHVFWEDPRIRIADEHADRVELTWDEGPNLWIPDLYIRQLREMKVLTVFRDIASIRLYSNSTLKISIG